MIDPPTPRVFGLLWDVDGAMAETEEEGHLQAFNAAFVERGLPWCWSMDRHGQLLQITGGEERLRHWLATAPPGAPKIKPGNGPWRQSFSSASNSTTGALLPLARWRHGQGWCA